MICVRGRGHAAVAASTISFDAEGRGSVDCSAAPQKLAKLKELTGAADDSDDDIAALIPQPRHAL